MSKLLKSKFLLGVLVVTVLVVGGVVAVKADTAAAESCSITTTLRAGSTGVEVQCLQTVVGAVADGNFGPMTKAAVMAWQAGKGLVADGVFGPLSRANWMGSVGTWQAGCTSGSGYSTTTGLLCTSTGTFPAGCTSTSGYSSTTGAKCDGSGSTPTGPLTGGAGSITVDDLPTYASEEVGEGEEDVKVLAFEVEAEGSDVEITSVKVEFVESGATSSEDLDDYAQSVSVWFDGEKVGEADVDDFSESSTEVWTRSISLDSGVIIREDDTEKLEIAITANNTIDSNDSDTDLWTVDVLNARFEDAEGVVTTESTIPAGVAKVFSWVKENQKLFD
ncbi:MAG: Cell wall lytic activity [Candidatus Nomurabacteria bacterium GW2011_GWB1_40_7]|uniref:Cell wall lytic activity n=1 Tax=Candidatus Nomurabacteria bacterium GW2011_GWB1_40_7 TaxID=1618744 RepID=A0A0G0VEF8_9BACT|nr:MAG: Cell wall lytic activity [Candidatus Nomurabacteria bacterium GW2011_GWB1_40_7]